MYNKRCHQRHKKFKKAIGELYISYILYFSKIIPHYYYYLLQHTFTIFNFTLKFNPFSSLSHIHSLNPELVPAITTIWILIILSGNIFYSISSASRQDLSTSIHFLIFSERNKFHGWCLISDQVICGFF
ncbi:hypothetical protein QVD17_04124 [Tagetes erecta]|uniref:Uncharacterized protein n=1 Tax=Tagetes erecta TaxID=13708 RepID=A0AAD8PAI1_TARER|nr:hypothetical protein QVD17_04124 [Tagetes erecta]